MLPAKARYCIPARFSLAICNDNIIIYVYAILIQVYAVHGKDKKQMDVNETEKTEQLEDQAAPEQENEPGGFMPIFTQEEFNAAIKKRLDRQKSRLEREFAERLKAETESATNEEVEALKEKTAKQDELLQLAKEENEALKAEKKAREIQDIKLYQAREYGIPVELLDNITGSTPDEIERSAANLAAFTKKLQPREPLYNAEPAGIEPKRSADEAGRAMLAELETMRGADPFK